MKALQGEDDLLKQFKAELPRAARFYVGMALVTKSGMDVIQPLIERCLERGGRGCVLFGVDLPTDPAAIERLCKIQELHNQTFVLRRFQPGRTFFHPKLSIFVRKNGAKTAIVGSSNLTGGGLCTNYESNVLVDERKVVQQLLDEQSTKNT
jgi:HKD family nuclease